MKKVTVVKIRQGEETIILPGTRAALRALRPLGVRFAVEEVDGADTTVSAWLEEKEPRVPKERNALNRTLAKEVATDNYTKGVASPAGAAE